MGDGQQVQGLIDRAVVNLKQCSLLRKEKWNEKSKAREFRKDDQVLMRKSGMNTKLAKVGWVPLKL